MWGREHSATVICMGRTYSSRLSCSSPSWVRASRSSGCFATIDSYRAIFSRLFDIDCTSLLYGEVAVTSMDGWAVIPMGGVPFYDIAWGPLLWG